MTQTIDAAAQRARGHETGTSDARRAPVTAIGLASLIETIRRPTPSA